MIKSFFVAVIFLGLFTTECTMQKQNRVIEKPFDIQGHRGCRGLMPENTIPAMRRAVDLHVTTLEMDVVITKDGKIIVSHEPFFNHEISTKPDGTYVQESEEKSFNIYRMTYEQIKGFDVGLKPHPRFPAQQKLKAAKPLLTDVIDSVENYIASKKISPVYYNIETKTMPATDNIYHPAPETFVDLLMNVIQAKGIEKRVIIQSFDFRTLQYVHVKFPYIKTAMLIEEDDNREVAVQIKSLGFSPSIYSPAYILVNEELIKKCHELKIKIIPWTVNDKVTINKLQTMGADGIITDFPNLVNAK